MKSTPSGTEMAARVATCLERLRARTPLVHNITNLVVTNSTANALLAIGASPAMVEAPEEVAEFARVADALVINLGTMSATRAAAMAIAAGAAHAAGTPWILDPVAVGALGFRSEVAVGLLAHRPQVIRGNASEILALARLAGVSTTGGGGRGVDSLATPESALASGQALAASLGCTVVISGPTDFATDGAVTMTIGNGHPMMPRVTGLGCTATALVGACLAVEPDPLAAGVSGMVLAGLAGEIAGEQARGPGSLQTLLLDALYALDTGTILARARIGQWQPGGTPSSAGTS